VFMLAILSITSSLGYPEEGLVFMLAILFIISSLGYREEGFVFMLANGQYSQHEHEPFLSLS
jgi:hypothetical protein